MKTVKVKKGSKEIEVTQKAFDVIYKAQGYKESEGKKKKDKE